MLSRIMIVIICLASFVTTVEARMYKWVDSEGVTQYSQSPPVSGTAKEIAPPPLPSATRKMQKSTTANADSNVKNADKSATKEKDASASDIAESEKIRKNNCSIAKSNLDLYTNLGKKLLKTPDGLYKRLTEDERQEKIKQSEESVKEFCSK